MARRCFATSGHKVKIDFRINDGFIGQEIAAEPEMVGRVTVAAPVRIARVDVYRNFEPFAEYAATSKRFQASFDVPQPSAEEDYYHVRVRLAVPDETSNVIPARVRGNLQRAQGRWAWSTPIWVLADS
jgi:hypothetical protein